MIAERIQRILYATSFVCVLLSGSAGVVAAQQTPQDTAPRTPQQQVMDRLRNLRPLGAPDSVENADSVRAQPQQIRVQGGGRDRPRGDDVSMGRDSVWNALLQLEGLVATEYKGDSATFRADSSAFKLQGNALVLREGQQIQADLINYSGTAALWCGYGSPRVSGVGESALQSDSLCYDVTRRTAVVRGATTSISEGALWRMYSETLTNVGDRYYSHDAKFTDCDLPWDHVHYDFRAKKVLAIHDNILVARDVTLYFADVPVFRLPFMVQSLSQGRRSGVLMPRFGINDIARTSSRYNRRIEDVGFYWAINDYMGSELAMDWMSNNYTALRGSYDYNFARNFLRGGVTARRFWKNEGGTEFTVASQNNWEPNERTTLNANVNYSTSSAFVRQQSFDPRELNRSIDSNLSMNRRFDWGSMTVGSSRKQFLSDNTVQTVFPNASFNLNALTLFKALPGEERFYSNATLSGNATVNRDGLDVGAENTNPSAQSKEQIRANISTSFRMGKLSITPTFSITDAQAHLDTVSIPERDTIVVLPAAAERTKSWGLRADYQQRLIGSMTFEPAITLRGEDVRSTLRTNDATVTRPMSLEFGAALRSDVYGMWPGVGPFERLRHRVSPTITYAYSPSPTADSLQNAVFSGLNSIRERNRIELSLNQTFEGKRRITMDSAQLAAAEAAADTATGPVRLPTAQTVSLLSITTSAIAYDFVRANEFGDGLDVTTLNNNLRSELIPGFDVSFTHDLFRTLPRPEGGDPLAPAPREFAPQLTNVAANVSFNSGSWLFRLLGLGRGDSVAPRAGDVAAGDQQAFGGMPADRTQEELGMIGTRRMTQSSLPAGPVGSWTAQLRYNYQRPRTDAVSNLFGRQLRDQSVAIVMGLQPTENWKVQWDSRYSLETGDFSDQIVTLTRRLHDWDANFDFVKAQNGNFTFNFRVNLRANPDIKLDYSQRDITDNGIGTRFR